MPLWGRWAVIIKTARNPNAGALFRHLTRLDHNERVDVAQLRGVVAEGFQGALAEMEAVACGTQCEKNFYHISVAIQDDEKLKREQWLDVAERIGQEFGIEDHARAVVFHVKDGKEHMHVVFSRIDPDTMKAVHLSHDYRRNVRMARELEQELGLNPVRSRRIEERELQRPAHDWEDEYARRQDTNPRGHRNALADCYRSSDCGKAFVSALDECGFNLYAGESRSYLALDRESGTFYAVDKRLTGDSASRIRTKLDDLPPLSQLPSSQERTRIKREEKAKGGRGTETQSSSQQQDQDTLLRQQWRDYYCQQAKALYLLTKQQKQEQKDQIRELDQQILKERKADPRANWFKRVGYKLIGRDLDAERDARDQKRIKERIEKIEFLKSQHLAEQKKLAKACQSEREELIRMQKQQDQERRREQDKAQGIVRARLTHSQENEKDRGR